MPVGHVVELGQHPGWLFPQAQGQLVRRHGDQLFGRDVAEQFRNRLCHRRIRNAERCDCGAIADDCIDTLRVELCQLLDMLQKQHEPNAIATHERYAIFEQRECTDVGKLIDQK